MPKRKSRHVDETKTWRRNRKSETARKVELYSATYKLARAQIPPILSRDLPDIFLRIHASIRRQLKAGETDAHRIAVEAIKDVLFTD